MTGTIRSNTYTAARARRYWAQQLPLPCPFCGLPVTKDTPYDLDHALPVVYGGTDADVRPAHSRCNRRGGAAITNAHRAAKKNLADRGKNSRRFFRDGDAGSRPAEQIFHTAETRDRDW